VSALRDCLLGALLLFGIGSATAGDVAPGVRAQLEQAPVVRGSFEQTKELKGFRHPLRSGGGFLLVRDRGVIWETRSPFPSSVVLTRERLLVRQPDGSTRVLLDRRESAAMSAVNALLLALIGADLDALATQFELRESVRPGAGWRLELLPIDPALARVFARIVLDGDRHVREVVIEEREGDRSTIRFTGIEAQPAAPDADEARRLD
jgi:hypothetical protein